MSIKKYKKIDLQYFGNVNYFLDLVNNKYIYFNNALVHSKGLQINRTSIMGANKVLVLSVPLEGGRAVKMNVKDLKIASRELVSRPEP